MRCPAKRVLIRKVMDGQIETLPDSDSRRDTAFMGKRRRPRGEWGGISWFCIRGRHIGEAFCLRRRGDMGSGWLSNELELENGLRTEESISQSLAAASRSSQHAST